MKRIESIAFGHGRQSLDRSVWYNGWLRTFLGTGEETHGQFALMEAVARRGNVAPPHIHDREDEIFYVVEGKIVVSVGDRTIKGTAGTMFLLPREVPHSFTIEADPDGHSAHSRRAGRMVQGVQCAGTGHDLAASR